MNTYNEENQGNNLDELSIKSNVTEFDLETGIDLETDNEEKMNPWFSIWIKPRKTIKYIINNKPRQYVILLAILLAIFSGINKASYKCLGDHMPLWGIFTIVIIGGVLLGYLALYIRGVLLSWTGKWIGGVGSTEDITTALAWSSIPVIFCNAILLIPELILFGSEMYTSSTPKLDSSFTLTMLLFVFGAIEIGAEIWAIILGLKCLSEVQGFSVLKALANFVLAGLVVIIPVAIFALMIILL